MDTSRRSFLRRAGQAGLALGTGQLALDAGRAQASPNEKITLGIIGIRGRGYAMAMRMAVRGDCQIAYLADVDSTMFDTPASSG